MKNLIKHIIVIIITLATVSCSISNKPSKAEMAVKDTIQSILPVKGLNLIINFEKGDAHNHPTFVFWTEDMNENYLQTLYITRSFATGIFGHGPINDTLWGKKPGIAKRPAALPYWWHKYSPEHADVPSPDKPIVDAYTGATPEGSFALNVEIDTTNIPRFRLFMEINQPWDWNDYWTTNKYPGDNVYKTSCQPSLIYSVTIDLRSKMKRYYLNPVGHGHYSGKNGILYTDLSTITSAKRIINKVYVEF
jgi:hypothetical protein